jgi:hypothetical protein
MLNCLRLALFRVSISFKKLTKIQDLLSKICQGRDALIRRWILTLGVDGVLKLARVYVNLMARKVSIVAAVGWVGGGGEEVDSYVWINQTISPLRPTNSFVLPSSLPPCRLLLHAGH